MKIALIVAITLEHTEANLDLLPQETQKEQEGGHRDNCRPQGQVQRHLPEGDVGVKPADQQPESGRKHASQ